LKAFVERKAHTPVSDLGRAGPSGI